jgi:DNA invertase Pin-like site-specific DNA recombinase
VQREDILAFCAANGHRIVAEYTDTASGAKHDRPGFLEMLEAAKRKEFSAVVVRKGDRLARLVKVDGYLRVMLETYGVRVLSATEHNASPDDDDGELMDGVRALLAQKDRKDIIKRLASARRRKNREGGYGSGQPCYGTYAVRKSGVLHHHEGEFAVLKRMIALREQGLTLRAIAAELNAEGVGSRTGKQWSQTTVRGALMSADRAIAVAPTD